VKKIDEIPPSYFGTDRKLWNLEVSLLDVREVNAALQMLRKCFDGRYKMLGDQHPAP